MRLYNRVAFGPFDDFGDVAESKACNSVGAAVVNGDASGFGVVESGAGESNVRHVACELVDFMRRNQIWSRAGNHFPRLFAVEKGRAESVDITVA